MADLSLVPSQRLHVSPIDDQMPLMFAVKLTHSYEGVQAVGCHVNKGRAKFKMPGQAGKEGYPRACKQSNV